MWVVTDFVNGEHSSQGAFPPTAAANAAEEAASRKAGGGGGIEEESFFHRKQVSGILTIFHSQSLNVELGWRVGGAGEERVGRKSRGGSGAEYRLTPLPPVGPGINPLRFTVPLNPESSSLRRNPGARDRESTSEPEIPGRRLIYPRNTSGCGAFPRFHYARPRIFIAPSDERYRIFSIKFVLLMAGRRWTNWEGCQPR